ncbi:MAG: DUF58 domain-containing protein [Myxococcota bacterium]
MAGRLARWLGLGEQAGPGAPDSAIALDDADLARAARLLEVRTRREATGLFAGAYTTAFRGGGMEFHESQPYVPGDDVRALDWNAMARTGEPFVKRFREERDQTLLLGLDTSASMALAARGEARHRVAAHAAALLAAAAGQAGDRVGLVTFGDAVREGTPPGRGASHTWRLIRDAARASEAPRGSTRLAAGLEALLERSDARAVCVVLSDFRDSADPDGARRGEGWRAALAALAGRHEVVSIVLYDPGEAALPGVGLVRMEDPERPGRVCVLDSGRPAVRARYRRAWAARSQALESTLRSQGSDVLWMRTDRDPLHTLMHYFHRRAARSGRSR